MRETANNNQRKVNRKYAGTSTKGSLSAIERKEIIYCKSALSTCFKAGSGWLYFYLRTCKQIPGSIEKIRRTEERKWQTIFDFGCLRETFLIRIGASFYPPKFLSATLTASFAELLIHKLLMLLYCRYLLLINQGRTGLQIAFDGGLNGFSERIKAHLLEIAHIQGLATDFLDWLEYGNDFTDGHVQGKLFIKSDDA